MAMGWGFGSVCRGLVFHGKVWEYMGDIIAGLASGFILIEVGIGA